MPRAKKTEDTEEILGDLELETPSNTDVGTTDVIAVEQDRFSEEWSEHVLSQFTEDEMVEGCPTSAGLRRVAQIILGPIRESGPTFIQPPQDDNTIGRATVCWWVEFVNGLRFGDVADCSIYNTDDAFQPYGVATAATRAEARALRKALGLNKASFDEITSKDTAQIARDLQKDVHKGKEATGEVQDKDAMSTPQENLIDIKCKQLGVNGVKLFSEVFSLSAKGMIQKKQASAAIDKLNEYQKELGDIPDSIKGYVNDWRN